MQDSLYNNGTNFKMSHSFHEQLAMHHFVLRLTMVEGWFNKYEYRVLSRHMYSANTRRCVWVKNKMNILYPRCKFNINKSFAVPAAKT